MSADRFPRPVVCAWCGNRHRAIVPIDPGATPTQGDACAASVYQVTEEMLRRSPDLPELAPGEWFAQGHYGSSAYDCRLFHFVRNPPTAPADPVCDNCVGERLVAGDLQPIEGHYPW